MKSLTKILAPAGLALAAMATTVPATAQVQGNVATASISRALLNTTTLQNAFAQVSQTYSAQIATLQTKQTELSGLLTPYDTNNNGSIDDNEAAAVQSAPNFAQIQTLRAEIGALEEQVTAAQVYAVEQVLAQYSTALREVATQGSIVMVTDPSSLQYVAEGADITQKISTALDAKALQIGIVPPNGWRPTQNGLQVFQEIQQRLVIEQIRRQQQAAQQQQQQPSTPQPQGR